MNSKANNKVFYKTEMINGVDYMIKFFCRVGKKGLFAHRIGQMSKVGVQSNHLHTLRLLLIVSMLSFLFGCAHELNSGDYERHYASKYGKVWEQYPYLAQDGWKLINKFNDINAYEYIHSNGCAYAVKVNIETKTIEGFRFTSDRVKCDKNYVFP